MDNATQSKDLIVTARLAGVWYFVLAIAGLLGFMVLHGDIYVANPSETLNNITEKESIARLRLILELVIIISQALAAVWFYKLFEKADHVWAWALAVWGTVNSGVIMISAVAMGCSLGVAESMLPVDDKIMAIQILQELIKNSWRVGGLFFGLWLIPMGLLVIRSQRMPIWLGRVLIVGGTGYLLNTFLKYVDVTASWVDMLIMPATIGELWMVGYLLIFGIRPLKD